MNQLPSKCPSSNGLFIPRSRSLEITSLALWQEKVSYIKLVKSEKGLGFSLIDYQHNQFTPLSKTMIVIRALVPSGVAQTDGRLMPGQRLVSINETSLDPDIKIKKNKDKTLKSTETLCFNDYNLDQGLDLLKFTVRILKSLPCDKIVRLGVQKPLPYPEAIGTKRISRAKSQHIPRTKKDAKKDPAEKSYQTVKNFISTEPLQRKKKKKNLKRRKKIITTSQYDLKSEDESEILTECEDRPNKTYELLKYI